MGMARFCGGSVGVKRFTCELGRLLHSSTNFSNTQNIDS